MSRDIFLFVSKDRKSLKAIVWDGSDNTAERALRAPVMGRNNFQGFRSIDGADVAMMFYSIIASCKAVRVEPRTYMLQVAIRSAHAEELMTPYQYAVDLRNQVDLKVASEFEVFRQAN